MKKTKTTYLIDKVHADGSVRLSVVSSTEWSAVARRNKEIPADQRRYFIVDYIAERDRIDRMVIETTFEAYSEWNREHARTERNRKLAKSFRFYSLEDVITRENGGGYPEMDNKAEYSVEDQIFDRSGERLYIHPVLQGGGGKGVPQIMEADMLALGAL